MIDGREVSQPPITAPKPIERRSVERRSPTTQEQIKSAKAWVRSKRELVKAGLMEEGEFEELVARSMVAREKLTARARDKTEKVSEIATQAVEASRRDPLTKLLNKGVYMEEYARLAQSGQPFGVLILDIDHFKKVNDIYGHQSGDAVLMQTAMELETNVRELRPDTTDNDLIFRYGGEEFVVLSPTISDESGLLATAERLRRSIESSTYTVTHEGADKQIKLTASLGAGIFRPGQSTNGKEFFDLIDKQGLYKAKAEGRNKTVMVSS